MIVVTNSTLCQSDFITRIENIAMARPEKIIFREKSMDKDAYEYYSKICSDICKKCNVNFTINSDLEIAKKIGITSVHIPFDMLVENKEELHYFNEVGVSVHSIDEAKIAENLGANYLIAGHIYTTECKKNREPRGLDFLEKVCLSTRLPVYAIGGVNKVRAVSVLERGAKGFCVMSELMTCPEPYEKVIEYNKITNY